MLSSHSSLNGDVSNPFADAAGSGNPAAARPVSAATIQAINIRHHVSETLNFEESNFSTWQTFFNITFRKLGITDHINGRVDAQMMLHDVEWTQIDQCIVSWLYTTVSRPILHIIIQPSDTAEHVWTAINNLFLDNRLQRAVFAKREFHDLRQEDLSITALSTKLKCLADTLRDVGSPLSDQDLLLAFINGLSDDYGHCIAALTMNPIGLTFTRARSALLQEERRLGRSAQVIGQSALIAGGSPSAPDPPSATHGWRGKKKKKQATTGAAPAPTPAAPGPPRPPAPVQATWPHGAYPLSGMFHAWPPGWRAPGQGILGPRPTAPHPQAHASSMTPYYSPVPAAPQPSAWDQAPLLAALNNLSMQGQGNSNGAD
jgi:hypothetical protein